MTSHLPDPESTTASLKPIIADMLDELGFGSKPGSTKGRMYSSRFYHAELNNAITRLLADQLQSLCTAVIGSDPQFLEDGSLNPMPYETHNIREELRSEQRQRLTKAIEQLRGGNKKDAEAP